MTRDAQVRGMISAETMMHIFNDILNFTEVPSEAKKAFLKTAQERLATQALTDESLVSPASHSPEENHGSLGLGLIAEVQNIIQDVKRPYLKPQEISVGFMTGAILDDKRMSWKLTDFIFKRRDEVQESLDKHEISPKVWKLAARLVQLIDISHTVADEHQLETIRNLVDGFATANLKQYAQDFKKQFLNQPASG